MLKKSYRNFIVDKLRATLARYTVGLSLVLSLCGCAQLAPPAPDDPMYAPAEPIAYAQPVSHSGSLYWEAGSPRYFVDRVAFTVGDTLTILLSEATDAEKSTETKTTKKNDTDITNPTLFGTSPQINVPGIIPLVTNKKNNLEFSLEADRTFTGKGDSTQSNSLTGNITVTVARVLPNGNLYVRGEKWMTLNTGDEFIRISGIVRPDDISPDNTVMSTRVANARFTYSGRGQIAETNVIGWLARFFNGATKLWPY